MICRPIRNGAYVSFNCVDSECAAAGMELVVGDQFVVRGLPLLAVLGWLREAGELRI